MFSNCHLHSIFSDGVYTPEQLCDLAVKEGYRAVILTDHDTARGSYFMNRAARERGLLNILGTEFYAVGFGVEFHLLGFDYNPDNKRMQALLARASSRQTIKSKILFEEGLKRGSLRDGISWQDVLDAFPYNDYFCNNQVFEVMVKRGIYKREEYFDEFLYPNFSNKISKGICKELIEAAVQPIPHISEVAETIIEAGGVPIVAHPTPNKRALVKEILSVGVRGFETIHPSITPEDRIFFDQVCTEMNLYKMGGTDHSGPLGGFDDNPNLQCNKEDGYVSEENFMKIYERRLG